MTLQKFVRMVTPVAIAVATLALLKAIPEALESTAQMYRPTATSAKPMKRAFRPLPKSMTVQVLLVPQKEQRYETLGDWIWKGSRLEIRLSREFTQRDPRYGVLLLTHELLEALLCRSAGISTQQVDAFDVSFKGEGEPGDDPSAPYHRQHRSAEAAERALAGELGVEWRRYLGG
ncbi:MAG TPA: hypothetical protein VGY99_01420 [Candidatus Binataceae bacterium]|nr:hypothetical protein [Candidatus Binataceae bacterium]